MATFEYKIIVSAEDDETDQDTLNDLGARGWELVNALADVRANEDAEEGEGEPSEDNNVPVTVFYLKRARS